MGYTTGMTYKFTKEQLKTITRTLAIAGEMCRQRMDEAKRGGFPDTIQFYEQAQRKAHEAQAAMLNAVMTAQD